MALPLYPQLKTMLDEFFTDVMDQARRRELGVFGSSPRFIQHEGSAHSYNTVDGHERRTEFQQVGVEIQLSADDFKNMGLDDVLRLVIQKGQEFGGQEARHHFQFLDEVTAETGNVAEGPITLETFLETIDKLHISFDDQGNPRMPTVIIHPQMRPRIEALIQEAQTNPEIRPRLDAIIDRKRREWHEEEDRRKLVD